MSTEQRKPFMDRFNEMLAIAAMRKGYIGNPSYYGGYSLNEKAYKMFRLGKVSEHSLDYPSIEGARCPKCRAKLVLTDVHETVRYGFAGTFEESDIAEPMVQGKLVCPRVKKHTDDLGHDMTEVHVNSSIAELVRLIGEIADEKGY